VNKEYVEEEGEEKVVDFYPVYGFIWKEKGNICLRYTLLM
jgi:hypothetical protein